MDTEVLGVNLSSQEDHGGEDLNLGIILVEHAACSSVAELRTLLCNQLATLPPDFVFLTKHRWRVSAEQESAVPLDAVLTDQGAITIQRHYQVPASSLSVVRLRTRDGAAVGVVFVDLTAGIAALRDAVRQQLGRDSGFQLLDAAGFPILPQQEHAFCVLDLLGHAGVITLTHSPRGSTPVPPGVRQPPAAIIRSDSDVSSLLSYQGPHGSSSHLQQEHPFCSTKDLVRRRASYQTEDGGATVAPSCALVTAASPKQIVISYVRAEAADHALQLKWALSDRGYTVFLDVHEIKYGVDWQDSLNSAVSLCEAFIPLVTPRYGETQWTNREVKLADVLSKFILPVSFVRLWPPRCLAIQFATTQFIPYRDSSDWTDPDEDEVVRAWEEDDLQRVAEEINNRLKDHRGNNIDNKQYNDCGEGDVGELKKTPTLLSCPLHLPDGYDILSQNRDGKPLVVIINHPKQHHFARALVSFLEDEGMEAWCSSDLALGDGEETGASQLQQATAETDMLVSQSSLASSTASMDADKMAQFQQKADEAGVVVFVLSKAFAASRVSQQQVFYCEQRKRVLPLQFEDFTMPGWLSMLIGTGDRFVGPPGKEPGKPKHSTFHDPSSSFSQTQTKLSSSSNNSNNAPKVGASNTSSGAAAAASKEQAHFFMDSRYTDYRHHLLRRLRAALSTSKDQPEEGSEQRIDDATTELKQSLPAEFFVYVAGGTKFYSKQSADICREIGKNLAALPLVNLSTGGFYGVGSAIGQSYNDEKLRLSAGVGSTNVWHILPNKEEHDCSLFGNQMPDCTFPPLAYGTTLYSGQSVRDREAIVARCFDVCILIEGGPGAAHEAEQFVWNDRIVVPISVTGGAAGGKFNVPTEIFTVPRGVSAVDWGILSNEAATADDIGQAVGRIVAALHMRIAQETTPPNQDPGEFTSLVSSSSSPVSRKRRRHASMLPPGERRLSKRRLARADTMQLFSSQGSSA